MRISDWSSDVCSSDLIDQSIEGALDDSEGDWVQIAVHDAPLLSVQRDDDGAGCIGLRAATGRYDDCAVIDFDDGWAFHRLLADSGARQQARLHIHCIARARYLANDTIEDVSGLWQVWFVMCNHRGLPSPQHIKIFSQPN